MKLGFAGVLAAAVNAPGEGSALRALRLGAPVFLKTDDPVALA